MINITDKHNCCGCEACVQACPKHCISFEEDSEGFSYPKVDESLCVKCGACEKACPTLSPYESRSPQRVCGAINPDDTIREQSSSGGIFTMLAERVIQEGGIVFGVRFNEQWEAVFDYADTVEGLAAFRGSKYVQARVGNAFKEVRDFLKKGRKVLFTGTPCQVAALRHFLNREYDNLLLVDFICHGVPSPKVWRLYLDEVKEDAQRAKNSVSFPLIHSIAKRNASVSGNDVEIRSISFRDKRKGWKKFSFVLSLAKPSGDGKLNTVSFSHIFRENHYMRIFLDNVILRPSCYDCKAKEGRSGSDLTIADFWGIDKLNPLMDDDKGTSLVLVDTNKGTEMFSVLQLNSWQTQYEDVFKYNPGLRNASMHPKRSLFFAHLDNCKSVILLIDDTLRPSFIQRLKRLIK